MANMNDVAKYAGVSKSTVSKVLNNYPNLSDKTVKIVMDAITELGYVPNQTASSLSKKDFKKVGIIFKVNDKEQTIDEINMQYLIAIDDTCSQINIEYSVIFQRTLENKSPEEIIAYLKSKSITALVVLGLSKDEESLYEVITREIFPAVVTEVEFTTKKISSVGTNNFKAQYDVAKQAIEKYQAKKVLYIKGKQNGYITAERFRAMVLLADEFDLEMDYADGEFNETIAYDYIKNNECDFDLIVCASDLMAIGVKRALAEKQLDIPITGFDGISLLNYVGQGISSVKQDFYTFARESVHQAIRMQNGEPGTKIEVDYKLI